MSDRLHLPAPPTDAEKYWYMGRQQRWLLVLQALSFCLIAYSVGRFALADDNLLVFIVPMSLYAVTLLISLASSTRTKRTSLADHLRRVSVYEPARYPSVDVFLPSAGEPLEVLDNTYRYVAEMRWPGRLQVLVLDDSDRRDVEVLASRYGFDYQVRPNRGYMKKAGNLMFGYGRSDGDFIVVLDADFAPRADFLAELMPYADDPDAPQVGIVQSPQFFDTGKELHWLERCAGATQELFYRFIQPSRDAYRAAICVGTCAVYRRSALEASGGFAQIGHSEDVHTGVNMMKSGFELRYVPILVARGLCPETLLSFLNQQYRWCTGSMSLLKDPSFHETPAISQRQRLCFWSGFLYYISTAVNAFVAPLPALVMVYLLPEWVHPMNSVWLVGAVSLWFVFLPSTMHGRWRVSVIRVQNLYAFAHAVAIAHVITGRTKEWVATGAVTRRSTPSAVQINRTMKTYVGVTLGLLWLGLIRDTLRFGVREYGVMLALAILGTWIHLPMLALSAKGRAATPTSPPGPGGGSGEGRDDPGPGPDRSSGYDVVDEARGVIGAAATEPAVSPRRRVAGTALLAVAGSRLTALTRWRPSASALRARLAAARRPDPGQHMVAPGPRRWRPDIQGLRAVAVTLVVLYHAEIPRLTGGYVGVDVFFVISGFLITGQLMREVERRGKISFSSFYLGRIRRLLPAAAVVTVVTVILARMYMSIFEVQSVIKDAFFTVFYGINYRLAAEGVNYQQATGTPSPLQHFWSLAVEEQFYIIWPLLIMVCVVIGRRHYRTVVIGLLVGVLAVSLYFSVTVTRSDPPMAYFAIHTRAWELGTGALVALYAERLARMPGWLASLGSWTGLALIVYAAFHFNDGTAFPGTAALLPVLAAAAVIGAGCRQSRWSAEGLLRRAPMQQLGKISYSLYLWHWPLLVLIPLKFGFTFTWQLNLEIVAVSVWLAVVTVHLLERTTQRGRLRKIVWAPSGMALGGSMVIAALLVSNTLPTLSMGTGVEPAVAAVQASALQTELGAALGIIKVPADLEPPLGRAASDVPVSSADGCHADYLVVAQPKCVFGDPNGAHTIALIGDSHAQQWLPGIIAEADKLHWRVVSWTKAACPIANLQVVNDALHREFSECDKWRALTIRRVEALDPDVVVASQSDNVPGTEYSNTTWADATAKVMGTFRAYGLPVIYMMDTPLPNQSGPDCVAAHMSNVTKCIRDRTGPDSTYAYPGRHATMKATLAAAHITTVDPINWLCDPTKCPMVVNNLLVYRDNSHMSATYSRFLANVLQPLFVARKAK